jgi:hypothetical protein
MSVIGGSSPVITNGLVYTLDFGNTKTYISGSNTVKSLVYDATTTAVNGPFNFDNKNLIFTGTTTSYIQRSGSVVTTNPNSDFTICMVTNVIRPGSFLVQNTSTVNFAAQISTSSFDIGFYNTTTATYYTRRFPIILNTGSLYVACRYSNGTIDLFLNGLPVTSSQSNVILDTQVTGSTRSDSLTYTTTGSLFIGALPNSVSTFSGSLAQFSIYNRALTSTEIYSNYVPHINSQYQLGALSLTKPYTVDENTLMYVSASGISSSAYITAIDAFITGLKSNNIWNKLSAIYPVIGSTTASQAINLKEPGINRLVYTGSWSASLSGSYPITSQSYLQLSGFDYPTIATSSAHITYLSYDLPQVTASLVGVDKPLRALGGEIFYSGSKTYHVFKTTGTSSFQVLDSSLTSVEVLSVAGGGAGSGDGYESGGGGAGGLVFSASFSIAGTSSITTIVGAGGTENGENSVFSTIVAFGGGRADRSGGSGGGGGGTFDSTSSFGNGIAGQGNNGGFGLRVYDHGSGGGGGAGAPGENAGTTASRAGSGGNGLYYPQYAGLGLGFPSGWFAGGGGGSNDFANPYAVWSTGSGGLGGGGNGSRNLNGAVKGQPGRKNTGGGGGGRGYNDYTSERNGGSGIVIVSYNTNQSAFTSSFGISLSGSNIVGNLHSTTNSGISFDTNASIGLVTVTRTGSTSISIHKDFNSSVITAPVTASVLGSVYANASNFAGTVNKVSPYTLSYLSYGSGLTPNEVNTYHSLTSTLQYDLGRALLLQGFPAAAAYSVRQISKNYPYAINVRRADDLQQDIGFVSGDLDTGSLLTFLTASVSTPLPGDTATPAVAYSVRKVRTLYTGSAMQVRRDSDDLTFDVGFDVAGNLDTSSLLSKMTSSLNTPTLPGDYSGLSAAYSLRRVSSSYSGYAVEVRRSSDNYSASIGFDGSSNLNTASLASFIRTGSEASAGNYSSISAAYSVRKVVSTYTGYAMMIQSASVSQSIGFDANGDLDINTIKIFAGSGDAFVKTWYDQSGNNNHASATNGYTSNQPKIYSGSQRSVVLENGKPAVHFNVNSLNTSNFLNSDLANNGLSAFTVYSPVSYSGGLYNVDFVYTIGKGTGTDRLFELMVVGPTNTPQYYNSVIQLGQVEITSSFTYGQKLFSQIGGNSSSSLFVNSSTTKIVSPISFPAPTSPPHPLYLGSFLGGSNGNFKLQEFILYNTQQFNNRTYIENNINSYYGIYTPSSTTTESAFVKTWYDQSGNNRHATQLVPISQPLIVSSGSLVTSSFAKPSVKFDGVNDYLDTATITVTSQSIFSVQQNIPGKGVDVIFGADGDSNYTNNINGNGQISAIAGTYDAFTGGYSTISSITSYHRDGIGTVSGSYYLNGNRLTQTNSGSTNQAANYSDLGGFGSFTFQGYISEFVLYNNYKASSRGLIEDNINGYYNIFTQSLASGSGYVTKWYDQSGNNRHVFQTTSSRQPLIVSSGSILTQGGKPAINHIATQDLKLDTALDLGTTYSMLGVIKFNSTGYTEFIGNFGWSYALINTTPIVTEARRAVATVNDTFGTDFSLFQHYRNGTTTINLYKNTSLLGGNTASLSANNNFDFKSLSGEEVDGYNFIGNMSEVLIYTSNQTTNKPSINNNINNYFNIYTPNSTTSSLFVTKWYDQSGNSKHALQTDSNKQPLILRSGSILLENQKPAINFLGTSTATRQGFDIGTVTSTPSDYSIYYVKNQKQGGNNPWLLIFGSSYLSIYNFSVTYFWSNAAGSYIGGTTTTPQQQHVGEIYLNSTTNSDSRAYENNILKNQGFTEGSYSKVAIPNLQISSWESGTYSGSAQEIIISTNNHLPVRSSIVSNINSYYRIY